MATLTAGLTDGLEHTRTIDESFEVVHSSVNGLSQDEAAQRLASFGPNELQSAGHISPWQILFAQFKNVLIVILLIATVLSAFLGHEVEAIAIMVIVLFAIVLSFVQEYRAENAIEALRKMSEPSVTVIRDGREIEIPTRDVVPGDVVVLRAGNRLPADMRLIEAISLQVQEAALTGESVPVDKHTDPITDPATVVGDRKNMVFAGTAVTHGRGRALVISTGMKTEFGKIATLIQSVKTIKTPLQENLDKLGGSLARAAFVVVALIATAGVLRGQPLIEMLVFGIALAVAVVPEALPAVVTISLAIGVQRMVKRNALIRRLPAVETLGSTSVICSDKTGTLTKDEMTVREMYVAGRALEVSGIGYEPIGSITGDGKDVGVFPPLERLLEAGLLSSDAELIRDESEGRWVVKGDPTEGALVAVALKSGISNLDLRARYPRIGEIPFSAETKRMTTIHQTEGRQFSLSKGAPEVILASCNNVLGEQGDLPLDEDGRKKLLEVVEAMAANGLRVLGVASNSSSSKESAERDMTFLGLFGMIDPPRPEVLDAVKMCESAGIRVVMITGDHPITAQAVARELGLLKRGRVTSGVELEGMSDEEFALVVEDIDVYARVSPAQKLRVVQALQKKNHVVAMTGDGVNDAPALKTADIGIAMGITGTDVAKEASAMMLTDDNFASIVAAVEEGRGIFSNIKKYLMFLLSSNLGEIGLMGGAMIMGLGLPLTAVQILYVNLATDGLPALALALDPPEKDLMQRRPTNPRTGLFTRPVITLITVGGIWSMIVNLSLFAWAMNSGRSQEEAVTMTFLSLVLIQFIKAYNFRSDRLSVMVRPFANKWLNRAIVWEIILLLVIVYLPALHAPFGTFSIPLNDWAIIIPAALTILPVLEAAKWMERKGWFGELN